MAPILVTGGAGFLASHLTAQLLQAGGQVRVTLRHSAQAADVLAMLERAGCGPAPAVQFVQADLAAEAGWAEAMDGCRDVHHVASPFPPGPVRDPQELIGPAREGTLRVLRAARAAGVRRVVMTSSFAAVGYGHRPTGLPFTEEHWSALHGADVTPYIASKTLAERAAWDYVQGPGHGLQLAAVNPVGIFGPPLGPRVSSSLGLIRTLLEGRLPFAPRIYFGAVDVRDVASLHRLAMARDHTGPERFIATAGPALSLHQVAMLLRTALGPAARRVPRWQAPDWLVRVLAQHRPALQAMVPQLGRCRQASSDKARHLLGWSPRPAHEALVASARALLAMQAAPAA